MAELSPMMRQYMEIKEKNRDSIVFFRLGDFYEMFYDDAEIASKELDLVLTGKLCGTEERAPMCGIPYHSCEGYIARLIEKGYRVAICEQTEDPATAKGLVKRDVVRVITPGTVIEDSMLDESRNNYLASICISESTCGVCFIDASTGDVSLTEFSNNNTIERLIGELGRFLPKEVLSDNLIFNNKQLKQFVSDRMDCCITILDDDYFEKAAATEVLKNHFKVDSLDKKGLTEGSPATSALAAAIRYLGETQMSGLDRISEVNLYTDSQYMRLDMSAMRNLELCETMRGKEKKGSLLWVLDKTKTAMGKRLIRKWIEQPLISVTEITARLNAVDELAADTVMRGEIREYLSGIHDIERLMTRIVYGTAGARELKSLSYTASKLPYIKELLRGAKSNLLKNADIQIDELTDVCELIENAIVEEPPFSVREGGIIKEGYNPQVDILRADMTDGKGVIARVEADEKERTGIKTLKVRYNRVFGYYIEVSNSFVDKVPPEYIRKQTLANCERYITDELKTLEARVLGAKDRSVQLEYQIFDGIRNFVAEQLTRIQNTAQAISQLDVLCSLAEIAVKNNYCRPSINTEKRLNIVSGRHPVVEDVLRQPFVPNDILLDSGDNRCAIITGPNMAGKSTFMRQVAIIVLMAHIGSFVPAQSADIGITDAIFTRVGASDDLAAGQSTFMVEMSEVANILKNATSDSLVIFDEIGRGTSTYDGMSIARAVLEYVADKKKLGAKTLFATHYHELTTLESQIKGVKNYNAAVKKHGDEITFLRKIVRGGADDSYGIEVAKLSGIPDVVINRAKQILKKLETEGAPQITVKADEIGQLPMELLGAKVLLDELKALDVNALTPIEAMNMLFDFISRAKEL
ncbi:MAG: DNA mismatch repair protein MutS [Oscillospiraceae bacterium]|nr:DNA mismatch repair protein MutS [Oscillospiraceae bacterium]